MVMMMTEFCSCDNFTSWPDNDPLHIFLAHVRYFSLNLALILSIPRAESARAVTGRRCPHSGEGKTKTAVTPERKVGKSFPRWEMNGLSEGYK